MQHQVIAEIEIEDEKIAYYRSVIIRQQFNAHHEFSIRIGYDVLEKTGSFKLSDAQKKIGKLAIIKLMHSDTAAVAYEFRGLICEINMEQSENFTSDLVLKGYSPTILMENGPHFRSFYKKGLKQIVQQLTKPLSQANVRVKSNPQHKAPVTYICQYRESTFHFMNRLSADFGEWFYYDGIDVFFGKPSSPTIEITYGEDVQQLQTKLRILPMAFSSYSYLSKNDSFVSSKAPSSVGGLDEYARYAMQESHKVFSEPVSFPVRQRIESKSDLDGFVKNHKNAMAADLEVLAGSSDNPAICIGAVADVKIARPEAKGSVKEDHGKFLITSIEHHLTENGKYYNVFEGIPSGIEVIPVRNISMPIAEPQIATVTDNADPDNMGRIKVQMLWQKEKNEKTDWLRVLTSDAGSSDDVAKNRGFMFIPEVGDQVLLCFRYNDADRPFVLGSIYHGKTGAGGGADNNTKSLSTKSGNTIQLYDKKGEESIIVKTPSTHTIEMNDKKGEEKITVKTQGQHVIEMSDKKGEEKITVKTKGLHQIEMSDKKGEEHITVNTKGKHVIELNDINGAESITIKDKNNNFIMIDTPGGCITVQDKNKNSIVIDSADNSINIKAKDTITLAASNINLIAGATVNVVAKASYNLATMNCLNSVGAGTILRTGTLMQMVKDTFSATASTINQTAKKDINTKAKEKITISSKDKLDQRAGTMDVSTDSGKLRLNASSDLEIKGTTVKTN